MLVVQIDLCWLYCILCSAVTSGVGCTDLCWVYSQSWYCLYCILCSAITSGVGCTDRSVLVVQLELVLVALYSFFLQLHPVLVVLYSLLYN